MGLFFEEEVTASSGCGACILKAPPSVFQSYGHKNATLLILKSETSRKEILSQRFFCGADDLPLLELRKEFPTYLSSIVRCAVPKDQDKKTFPKILDACRPFWEIDLQKPTLEWIICYGEQAFKSVTGLSNIGLWRQAFIPLKQEDRTLFVYPLLNPEDYEDRKRNIIKKLRDIDLKYFRKMAPKQKETFFTYLSPNINDHISSVKILTTKPEIEEAFQRFFHYPAKYFDYETTGLYPTKTADEKILSLSLSYGNDTVAFPVDHPGAPKGILELWKEYLRQTNDQLSVAHNLLFELTWTRHLFTSRQMILNLYERPWGDTKAKAFSMLIPPGRLSLGDLTHAYFGTNLKNICDVDPVKWYQYPLSKLLFYNGMDSLWTNRLDNVLKLPRWAKQEYQHHLTVIPSLVEMYFQGLNVDQGPWEEIRKKLTTSQQSLYQEIQKAVKDSGYRSDVNPASPTSLLLWFRYLDLDIENTKEETLQEMVSEHPVIETILEFKSVSKLKSTYMDGLEKVLHADGKFHPSYSSSSVKSGRLNCKDPNIQQIPKRKAAYVRKLFIPGEGNVFVAMDYAQLEVRVLACVCKDPNLIEYLIHDRDIHKEWAEWLLRRDPTAKQRYANKFSMDVDDPKLLSKVRGEMKSGFVFLSFYGGSAKKCAKMMGVELGLAEEAQDLLFKKYPLVKEYHQKTWEDYNRYGYIENLNGRRIGGVLSWNQVINLPIQSCGSDMTTESGARLCHTALKTGNLNLLPRINIHDDNTFNMEEETLEENIRLAAQEMVRPAPWMIVDFGVEVSVGKNWYEMKKFMLGGKETIKTSDVYPNFKPGV